MAAFWKLAQDRVLCDLCLLESDSQREHHVHRLVMYAASPYFKSLMDSGFKDRDQDRLVIPVERPGLLQVVIQAMYQPPHVTETLYDKYCSEHEISDIMHLYNLCSFLLLDDHQEYIQKGIEKYISIGQVTKWWKTQLQAEKFVPDSIECIVHEYLYKSIRKFSGTADTYVSIEALLNVWSALDDTIAESIKEFLGTLTDTSEPSPPGTINITDGTGQVIVVPPENYHGYYPIPNTFFQN